MNTQTKRIDKDQLTNAETLLILTSLLALIGIVLALVSGF